MVGHLALGLAQIGGSQNIHRQKRIDPACLCNLAFRRALPFLTIGRFLDGCHWTDGSPTRRLVDGLVIRNAAPSNNV
jgi:hypothetical protein